MSNRASSVANPDFRFFGLTLRGRVAAKHQQTKRGSDAREQAWSNDASPPPVCKTPGKRLAKERENYLRLVERLKAKAAHFKRETIVLYFAVRDRRTPWYAKAFVACVVAYALSPIDLIPDPIPILGYVDDLLLLPLGIYLSLKMIPETILADCREKASSQEQLPRSWSAAFVIVVLWIAAILVLAKLGLELMAW